MNYECMEISRVTTIFGSEADAKGIACSSARTTNADGYIQGPEVSRIIFALQGTPLIIYMETACPLDPGFEERFHESALRYESSKNAASESGPFPSSS